MTRELVGYVGVDAGIVWVGDPCYVMGADSSSGPKDWEDYCAKSFSGPDAVNPGCKEAVCEPLGNGIGFEIGGFGGDGNYPVYVTRDDSGLVTKVEVRFNE